MMRFYKNLKRFRKEAKMTQAQLGEATGYTPSAISKIEKGMFDVPYSSLFKFAEALGVYPGDLMGWDEPDTDEMTPDERGIIFRFRQMNQTGRNNTREYMDTLLLSDKFRKPD